MIEKIGSFSIITFLLSFILGIVCLYYILKIIISKKIIIKVMEDSLGDSATSPSIIAMVCIILALFASSFFAICLGIYFFTVTI